MAERGWERYLIMLRQEREMIHRSRGYAFLVQYCADEFMVKLCRTVFHGSCFLVKKIAARLVADEITSSMLENTVLPVWNYVCSSSIAMLSVDDEDFAYGAVGLVSKILEILLRTRFFWPAFTERIRNAFVNRDDVILRKIGEVFQIIPLGADGLFFSLFFEPVFNQIPRCVILAKIILIIREGVEGWPFKFMFEFNRICNPQEWNALMAAAIMLNPIFDEVTRIDDSSKQFNLETVMLCIAWTEFSMTPAMMKRILRTAVKFLELCHPLEFELLETVEAVLAAGLFAAVLSSCAPPADDDDDLDE